MTSATTTANSIEFALRAAESIAFCLHAVLGLTEPWTHCLRAAFRDPGVLPIWFWPVAGVMLLLVAGANFSGHSRLILAAQAYVAAFHSGAIFYHVHLQHQLVAGVAPGLFVVLAAVVTGLRTSSVVVAGVGTLACAGVAWVGSKILLSPLSSTTREAHLLLEQEEEAHSSPYEKAQAYLASTVARGNEQA